MGETDHDIEQPCVCCVDEAVDADALLKSCIFKYMSSALPISTCS